MAVSLITIKAIQVAEIVWKSSDMQIFQVYAACTKPTMSTNLSSKNVLHFPFPEQWMQLHWSISINSVYTMASVEDG